MSRRSQFETIRSEGALLPVDLLQRVGERDKDLGGLRGEDYGLPPNEPLNEAIVRSWNRLVGAWGSFREARERLPESDPGTSVTRDRWLLVLLQELGYGRVQTATAVELDGKSYAVSHAWGQVPMHLVGCRVPLDRRTRGVAGAATQSPHGTVQELLNRSDERLWGLVSNGLVLRVLRDNSSLTRQAYLEFDLEQMFEGEVYADFVLLWLACHASRVEGERPHECWLERWSQEAVKQGTRALDGLRSGVEEAISALGSGFLQPGRNSELRAWLRADEAASQEYYRELLRLVYRLLFLFVAEDRGLLLDPRASEEARARYGEWYSTRRLRELAGRRRGTKHGDLFEQLKLVMRSLGGDDGCPPLGLPPLGSFLWSGRALPHLDAATLPNAALLDAIRALATVRDGKVLRSVDYKNLGAEELGSVYESLLELHPELDADAGTFALTTAAGNERKTTGSYYTPSSLIAVLLDSALDPVLDEAAAKGEKAILELKVCDPACGSGHFLVAAAHRIAKRLASARTGDEEPSPEATRVALRDVVSRCLYGVDVNPMAVELCKVSLWMEALDPGRPLSFLDAHIKCGNSLLGTTVELLMSGIPDDAYKPLEGDDKKAVRALRNGNRDERSQIQGQLTIEEWGIAAFKALQQEAEKLESAFDTSLERLREQERLYSSLQESESYERARLAADAWCAAFVQRKQMDGPRLTTALVRRIASGQGTAPLDAADEVRRLAVEYGFFHWEIEYPAVFGRTEGGFDVMIGNPPWERVKLQEKEFFAGHAEIVDARNAAARKLLIAALAEQDPPLHATWLAALRKAEGESHFVRTSNCYPLCGRGDVNTYSIFAELMRSRIASRGRVGCIVPTGVATDLTTQYFFRDLVETRSLASFYCFKNERFLFSRPVEHTVTFGLLTMGGESLKFDSMEFCFNVWTVEEMLDPERRYFLSPEDFALLNPNTRTLPTFRTRRDADITRAVYERLPVVNDRPRSRSAWSLQFMTMIHMSNDSALFMADSDETSIPLTEAKMVHQFNHRWATYQQGNVRAPTLEELRNADFEPTPRYRLPAREIDARLGVWEEDWLLGWRDIARNTDLRTLIASVVPRSGVAGELILAFPKSGNPSDLLATLNSFALDYVLRQKLGGTHVKPYVLEQLPIPAASVFDELAEWDNRDTLHVWMLPRVLELVYVSHGVSSFAKYLGYTSQPFVWDDERRALIRAELDAAFFHLFGFVRRDVDYVMETFHVVRDRDNRAEGEYRTKRLILEIYDELAEAIATGRPYQTRLDPPPADPRVAHGSFESGTTSTR